MNQWVQSTHYEASTQYIQITISVSVMLIVRLVTYVVLIDVDITKEEGYTFAY